ncbi:hypothetical protein CRM22_009717 [Opisthorchis felineus]|uniref:Uncharacterized protein n=1 Tax=Opisthorchis felineus TaxID=147828 RepID=A0A4S2L603_OPIFE|nr:hypothetical protein CRM22_009717 [Opisthorchis felineus]
MRSKERLSDSLLFGNNLIRCGHSSMPTTITLDQKMLPAFETDPACNRKLTQLLTGILPDGANPRVISGPTPASARHEAILTSVPNYVIPDGCVKLTRKSLKVTKVRLAFSHQDAEELKRTDSMGHYVNIPFGVISALKLFQLEHHFAMMKSDRVLHALEIYEEPDSTEAQKLWKLLSTSVWNSEKFMERLGIVPKITEHIEECTITDTEVLIVSFTMTLSYPKPPNGELLKLRNDDPQVYEKHATQVDTDLATTLTQMELIDYVWSHSLDLLEVKDDSLYAWIFVKMNVNKMPPTVAKTYLESKSIEALLGAGVSGTTGRPQSLKPTIYNAVLTKSRIGCERKQNKSPAE